MGKAKQSIAQVTSEITYDELVEIEQTTTRRPDRPTSLPIDDIHLADLVFQLRKDFRGTPEVNRDHIRSLMGALRDGTRLDPVLVTPVGDKFYLVDGHHRFIAYKSVEWTHPVPIRVFAGSVAEAELEAGCENHKDKLPVSKQSKLEHAWTLVKRDIHSIARITQATGASPRTISNMRVKRTEIIERGDDPSAFSWKDAKEGWRRDDDYDREGWIESKASELAKRMCEDRSVKLVQWPEVLVKAIEMVSMDLPRRLVQCWPDVVLDVVDIFEEERRQEQEDLEALDI